MDERWVRIIFLFLSPKYRIGGRVGGGLKLLLIPVLHPFRHHLDGRNGRNQCQTAVTFCSHAQLQLGKRVRERRPEAYPR